MARYVQTADTIQEDGPHLFSILSESFMCLGISMEQLALLIALKRDHSSFLHLSLQQLH